jgi:hypothetical protein
MLDASGIRSELEIGMKMGNSLEDRGGLRGEVTLECFDSEGNLRWSETRKNLITDVGDQYYAQRAIAGVTPAAPADATKVTCMKLGTGATAVAKNGAGAGLVTYLSGTNVAFDSSNPSRSNNVVTYTTTFGPGVGTHAALAEIVIAVTNANSTSAAADCIARALISPTRNKQAGDTLVATWTHTFLGA